MKKILLTAMLIAGTTLGFAKDNAKSTNNNETISPVKTEIVGNKKMVTYHYSSKEELEAILKRCTDVYAVYQEAGGKCIDDGMGGTIDVTEYVLVGFITITYDC
ncbi:MAG: hypothetical protein QM564_02110 [Bergeyella sp.]